MGNDVRITILFRIFDNNACYVTQKGIYVDTHIVTFTSSPITNSGMRQMHYILTLPVNQNVMQAHISLNAFDLHKPDKTNELISIDNKIKMLHHIETDIFSRT